MSTVEEPEWIIMHILLCYWPDYYQVIKFTFLFIILINILNFRLTEFEIYIYNYFGEIR